MTNNDEADCIQHSGSGKSLEFMDGGAFSEGFEGLDGRLHDGLERGRTTTSASSGIWNALKNTIDNGDMNRPSRSGSNQTWIQFACSPEGNLYC